MGIADDITADWHASLAALSWQHDLGVDEVIGDAPVNRYDLPEANRSAPAAPPAPIQTAALPASARPADAPAPNTDHATEHALAAARQAADRAGTLGDLAQALAAFDLCELKRGARNTLFADGNPKAQVMILTEAPDRDEDIEGRPFAGEVGPLVDRMFAAIGLTRTNPDPASALYVLPVLPWRPPGDRDPDPGDIALMRPFLEKHIALADPRVIVVMGNMPLFALIGQKGIMRARGTWTSAFGRPVLPMVPPKYLLKNPLAKREAWADLLSLKARLSPQG